MARTQDQSRARDSRLGQSLPDELTDTVRARVRLGLIRILIVTSMLLGASYLFWRYTASINWTYWPIALALLAAETYSFIDTALFSLAMWRCRPRGEPPPPRGDETVDVFITCYNEPVELVRETVRAARAITFPHRTYVLDDGRSPAMQAMAMAEGAGYIVRSAEWSGHDYHAKAGNVNNALFQTNGEFLLILDSDQVPRPPILDRTLGYFRDPRVAFVQTPQWFKNVPPRDPFGSQAPLFYGPIQQGKDGWNAAFFCGSNAILRREALMQSGVVGYARGLDQRVRRALAVSGRVLRQADQRLDPAQRARFQPTIHELQQAIREAREALRTGRPLQDVTWGFQRRAEQAARAVVAQDLAAIRDELADLPGLDPGIALEQRLGDLLDDELALSELARRETSPLAAIETVRALLLAVDVDRADEAIPIMPVATISVTEDMATAMQLHSLGWRSVYHHEILAEGLAPEDLRTALQQRLRWAQGTVQVMLRDNPLLKRGLSPAQRLMYFATMWSYLSGFVAVVYLIAPILYLFFGWIPVRAYSSEFFWRLVPYLIANQLLFIVVGWGIPTWRGQQYSLALFPLWIRATTSAVANVLFKRKLGFVVTPKTRQAGASLRLIVPQLVCMAALAAALVYGLVRLALGLVDDSVATLVNVAWGVYDLVMLSAVIEAARYQPPDGDELAALGEVAVTAATEHGRHGAGPR